MNIQGVSVLSQQIIFSPMWYGIIAGIAMFCFSCFFGILWFKRCERWIGPVCWIFFILSDICFVLTFFASRKTILNHPSKIEYTIEITDDKVWKELGLNYTIKEKPYEIKEIYIIEGDYIDDNY